MNKYTFKVYPEGRGREVYSVIQISGQDTLDRLCEIILEAFNFSMEHLYEFCMDGKPYSRNSYQRMPEGGEPSTDIAIDKIRLVKGQKFALHYDFGDDWMFVINVQKIEETTEKFSTEIIKSKGYMEQYPDWEEDDFY